MAEIFFILLHNHPLYSVKNLLLNKSSREINRLKLQLIHALLKYNRETVPSRFVNFPRNPFNSLINRTDCLPNRNRNIDRKIKLSLYCSFFFVQITLNSPTLVRHKIDFTRSRYRFGHGWLFLLLSYYDEVNRTIPSSRLSRIQFRNPERTMRGVDFNPPPFKPPLCSICPFEFLRPLNLFFLSLSPFLTISSPEKLGIHTHFRFLSPTCLSAIHARF